MELSESRRNSTKIVQRGRKLTLILVHEDKKSYTGQRAVITLVSGLDDESSGKHIFSPVLPVTDFILQFPFTVIKMTCIYNDDLQL